MSDEIKLAFTHNSKLANNAPSWGSVDKKKLPHVAFARKGEADKKSTWGYPHHWVSGGGKELDDNGCYKTGTLYLHKGGLNAAWSAANGGRSGQKAEKAVVAHLRKHFNDLGIKHSDLQIISDDLELDIDVAALDADLIAAGELTQADITPLTLSERIQLFAKELNELTKK